MPEILITNHERTSRPRVLARLPDASGSYKLNNGSPITLDLSQVKYQPARVVERVRSYIVPTSDVLCDGYGSYGYGSYQGYARIEEIREEHRVSVRSWPITLTSPELAGKPKDSDSESERIKKIRGERTIAINRRGEGVAMLPSDRLLIVRLWHPVINAYRDQTGKWIQDHYYPDEENYAWVKTLSARSAIWLRGRVSGRLKNRLDDRLDVLNQIEDQQWRDSHPQGNYI